MSGELYWCQNCSDHHRRPLVALDRQLRCEICGSDAVESLERLFHLQRKERVSKMLARAQKISAPDLPWQFFLPDGSVHTIFPRACLCAVCGEANRFVINRDGRTRCWARDYMHLQLLAQLRTLPIPDPASLSCPEAQP